ALALADRTGRRISPDGAVTTGETRMVSPSDADEMVDFVPIASGGAAQVGRVTIESLPGGRFRVRDGGKTVELENPRREFEVRFPAAQPFTRPEFGVTVLGQSSGMDADGLTSNHLVWAGQRGILVDVGPAAVAAMSALGIRPSDVTHVLLTHMHEDHVAGALAVFKWLKDANQPVRLIMEPGLYEHFHAQASAILGADLESIYSIERVPLRLDRPLELGRNARRVRIEALAALHGTPTTGFRLSYRGRTLVHSSDTAYDPVRIRQMAADGVIDAARASELIEAPFAPDATGNRPALITFEAGAPNASVDGNTTNHTSPRALALLPPEIREVLLAHHTAAIPPDVEGLTLARPLQTIDLGGTASSGALALEISRALAGDNDLLAELVVAPLFEGGTLIHFFPGFLGWHETVTPQMKWIGVPMIWGLAILGTVLAAYVGVPSHLGWENALVGFWLGGILGHFGYNGLARIFGWNPLTLPSIDRLQKAANLQLSKPGEDHAKTRVVMRGGTLVAHDGGKWARIFIETADGWKLKSEEDDVSNVQVTDDGRIIAMTQTETGRVDVLTRQNDALHRLRFRGWGEHAFLSSRGNTLMTDRNRHVVIARIYPTQEREVFRFEYERGARPPVMSRDGLRVAVQRKKEGPVTVYDLSGGTPRAIGRGIPNVKQFDLSADGTILSTWRNGDLSFYHVTEDDRTALSFRMNDVNVYTERPMERGALVWANDGNGRRELVRIVGTEARSLGNPFGDTVGAAEFSLDGRIAVADVHGDVAVFRWNGTTYRQIEAFEAYDHFNAQFALSADGRTLVSGSWDGSTLVYDLTDPGHPRRLARVAGDDATVSDLALSAD
ncbi:MAG: MBL fold metallo-hydrolase, partial [Elusimicrobia bacterium]|nr:MBL fold metallo-hydrolase [Elusimicrobiota bacterium]